MRHKGGNFSNYEDILTHKHQVSIVFQEVIPRDKSFATHRADFSSNYVLDQTGINLENMREVFVHNRPRIKNPSLFTQVSWFWRIVKNTVATRELLHFWSDFGKTIFSSSWSSLQMTFLMSQMITRQKYISNELSCTQFGIEEDLQEFSAREHFIFAPSFCTF